VSSAIKVGGHNEVLRQSGISVHLGQFCGYKSIRRVMPHSVPYCHKNCTSQSRSLVSSSMRCLPTMITTSCCASRSRRSPLLSIATKRFPLSLNTTGKTSEVPSPDEHSSGCHNEIALDRDVDVAMSKARRRRHVVAVLRRHRSHHPLARTSRDEHRKIAALQKGVSSIKPFPNGQ
jgi:hypothetical protein